MAMKFLVSALALLLSSGCMSLGGGGYHDVKIGMSEAEVKTAMRLCPNVSSVSGRYKSMTYLSRMEDFFQWGPVNYTFIFKDNTLVEFGEGNAVVVKASGEETLKLLPTNQVAPVIAEKVPPAVCTS